MPAIRLVASKSGPRSATFIRKAPIQETRARESATGSIDQADQWPALPLQQWKDTCATLHMRTQVIGKIRLALTPLINHWWNVPLYVNARGLTTSAIPYRNRPFELWFDFLDQELVLQ